VRPGQDGDAVEERKPQGGVEQRKAIGAANVVEISLPPCRASNAESQRTSTNDSDCDSSSSSDTDSQSAPMNSKKNQHQEVVKPDPSTGKLLDIEVPASVEIEVGEPDDSSSTDSTNPQCCSKTRDVVSQMVEVPLGKSLEMPNNTVSASPANDNDAIFSCSGSSGSLFGTSATTETKSVIREGSAVGGAPNLLFKPAENMQTSTEKESDDSSSSSESSSSSSSSGSSSSQETSSEYLSSRKSNCLSSGSHSLPNSPNKQHPQQGAISRDPFANHDFATSKTVTHMHEEDEWVNRLDAEAKKTMLPVETGNEQDNHAQSFCVSDANVARQTHTLVHETDTGSDSQTILVAKDDKSGTKACGSTLEDPNIFGLQQQREDCEESQKVDLMEESHERNNKAVSNGDRNLTGNRQLLGSKLHEAQKKKGEDLLKSVESVGERKNEQIDLVNDVISKKKQHELFAAKYDAVESKDVANKANDSMKLGEATARSELSLNVKEECTEETIIDGDYDSDDETESSASLEEIPEEYDEERATLDRKTIELSGMEASISKREEALLRKRMMVVIIVCCLTFGLLLLFVLDPLGRGDDGAIFAEQANASSEDNLPV
jgi:hypothetical protein